MEAVPPLDLGAEVDEGQKDRRLSGAINIGYGRCHYDVCHGFSRPGHRKSGYGGRFSSHTPRNRRSTDPVATDTSVPPAAAAHSGLPASPPHASTGTASPTGTTTTPADRALDGTATSRPGTPAVPNGNTTRSTATTAPRTDQAAIHLDDHLNHGTHHDQHHHQPHPATGDQHRTPSHQAGEQERPNPAALVPHRADPHTGHRCRARRRPAPRRATSPPAPLMIAMSGEPG